MQLEGHHTYPSVSQTSMIIPTEVSRENEVIIMSFLYKNNLLNGFLFYTGQCDSPLCECGKRDQTSIHVLTSCDLTPAELKSELKECIGRNNDMTVSEVEFLPEYETIPLLNCSRDPMFIKLCINVIKHHPHLRRIITLK